MEMDGNENIVTKLGKKGENLIAAEINQSFYLSGECVNEVMFD